MSEQKIWVSAGRDDKNTILHSVLAVETFARLADEGEL
jgi:hypothetical protein